jgi:UDPglucose--hexose-1-phosphate uridylyltransferase
VQGETYEMRNPDIVTYIDRLLQHAIDTGLIDETDRVQKKNELADLLKIDLGKAQAEIAEQRLAIGTADNSEQQLAIDTVDNSIQQLAIDAADSSGQQPALANQTHKSGPPDSHQGQTLSEILGSITDYAVETGLILRDTITYRDLFDTKVMGIFTPRQSEIIRRFAEIRDNQSKDTQSKDIRPRDIRPKDARPQNVQPLDTRSRSIEKATEYFYALCQASNYIRTDRIKKNRSWLAPTGFGDLAITINLSKPEKDPRDIAEAAASEQGKYPKCVLCLENVGYAGRIDHQARQNLRVIPLTLGGEQWYFQYSPYVYYNEHCILISKEHRPLVVDRAALERMLDFVQAFPHYFIGSNAGLPIVGGSILNHDHYQGGSETFPLDRAPFEYTFVHPNYPDVIAGSLKWPMAAVRLTGPDREDLLELASLVMDTWQNYEDKSARIIPYTLETISQNTGTGGLSGSIKPCEDTLSGKTGLSRATSHNAVTPTVRKDTLGNFVVNLVLRNNRTTPSHPNGLFHPKPELHHIKKENIGVIEVMGMAILPGRLDKELDEIRKILCGEMDHDINQTPWNRNYMLYKHKHWISELVSKYGNRVTADRANAIVKAEVGNRFLEVLLDASVFKRDAPGRAAFQRFIQSCGFVQTHTAVVTPTEVMIAKS